MSEIQYKQYTPEEDKIYDEAIAIIRDALKNGLNFQEACSMICVDDHVLRRFIVDDALKIMIAEMHYLKGLSLQQVSDTLNVPPKIINIANREMLEDAGMAAAEFYNKNNSEGNFGNA